MAQDLVVCLLARCGSSRFPNKAIAPVAGKPVIVWLIERLRQGLNVDPILATTIHPEDDALVEVGKQAKVQVYRQPLPNPNDVTGTVDAVVQASKAEYLFKALGDCPFVETAIVRRSMHVLKRTGAELFLWYSPPNVWPVYGAREFAIARSGWSTIVRCANSPDERRHPDLSLNRNRDKFNVIYHDPPDAVYYRHPQRLRIELDYPEDLQLIKAVAERGPGLLAPLADIIKWLDEHEEVMALNRHCIEKTGPATSYNSDLHRKWYRLMTKAPVYTWDNQIVQPLGENRAGQICCDQCGQLLGWGWQGRLYLRTGDVVNDGRASCPNCKAVRVWRRAL